MLEQINEKKSNVKLSKVTTNVVIDRWRINQLSLKHSGIVSNEQLFFGTIILSTRGTVSITQKVKLSLPNEVKKGAQ
jgi:hypothetical protein